MNDKLYRPNVGIALFNQENKLFLGNRISTSEYTWQMPQGGIDENEDIETATFRELHEETGIKSAEIIKIHEDWLYYDFPDGLAARLFNNKYIGQRQKWVALRFNGNDDEINLDAHDQPEFHQWQWATPAQAINLIVPFKKELYQAALDSFKDHY